MHVNVNKWTGTGWRTAAGFVLAVFLIGCPGNSGPPIKSVATLGEVMHDIIHPNAEVVWDAAGTIYTLEGVQEIQPRTVEEWMAVQRSATTLMEAGNLLMMDGRAKDNKRWMERAKALRDAGETIRKAAKERNVPALFERGGYLFDACQGCHFDYRYEADPKTIRSH